MPRWSHKICASNRGASSAEKSVNLFCDVATRLGRTDMKQPSLAEILMRRFLSCPSRETSGMPGSTESGSSSRKLAVSPEGRSRDESAMLSGAPYADKNIARARRRGWAKRNLFSYRANRKRGPMDLEAIAAGFATNCR